MDHGRGNCPDHDQKSVEIPKQPTGSRSRKKEPVTSEIKQCGNPKCARWFPCVRECFDEDKSTATGCQSYCVECKDAWELTLDSRFRRLREWLERHEPESWLEWEKCEGGGWGEFLRKVKEQGDCCRYCGADLREWQAKGHNLDRIDNNDEDRHTPKNTYLACWPCNKTRGRKRYRAWLTTIAALVKEYGWGQVSWSEEDDRFRRIKRRRCAHLAVDPPVQQPDDPNQLSLFGGAA